jgi:hypothetical protein
MSFYTEKTQYAKTALSDLQGAWQNLRDEVVKTEPFQESQGLLFHIDEAMSWENVRNLKQMRNVFLVIQNIAAQNDVPQDILVWVGIVRGALDEVYEALREGEIS